MRHAWKSVLRAPLSERQSHCSSVSQAPVSQEIGAGGARVTPHVPRGSPRSPSPAHPPAARERKTSVAYSPFHLVFSRLLAPALCARAGPRTCWGARSRPLFYLGTCARNGAGSTVNDRWAVLGLRAQPARLKACEQVVSAHACALWRFWIQHGSRDLFNKIF